MNEKLWWLIFIHMIIIVNCKNKSQRKIVSKSRSGGSCENNVAEWFTYATSAFADVIGKMLHVNLIWPYHRQQTCKLPDGTMRKYEAAGWESTPDPYCDMPVNVVLYSHTKPRALLYQRTETPAGAAPYYKKLFTDKNINTMVLIHGFWEPTDPPWMDEALDTILSWDYNVWLVKWKSTLNNKISTALNYRGAVADTRIIADIVASLIRTLIANSLLDPQRLILVGHSLGAHIAGLIGKQIKGIGMIVGLDPAGVYFDCQPNTGLTRDAAEFVQVLHTDTYSFPDSYGSKRTRGHLDFYANLGSRIQPGCIFGKPSCSHLRSIDIFLQATRGPCVFVAERLDIRAPDHPGIALFTKESFDRYAVVPIGWEWRYRIKKQRLVFATTSNEKALCPNTNDDYYKHEASKSASTIGKEHRKPKIWTRNYNITRIMS